MKFTIHIAVLLIFLFIGGLGRAEGPTSLPWSVPKSGHALQFPRDHGSHPDFKIEWWYLTGHLFSGVRRFGFQATFFRLAQKPVDVAEDDLFGTSQIYLAHMGLSDPENKAFLHEERLNRGGWDAGAKTGDLEVRNGNWRLVRNGSGMELEGSIRADAVFSLQLAPEKRHVIFGEDGISRKGPEGSAASYYITFPRLATSGSLTIGGRTYQVEGEAWMDHEISSSQLDRNQIGWDWTCIQLFDGREIMGYVLRTEDGPPSEYSKLVWVDRDGALKHHPYGEYEWQPDGAWTSRVTGATYPVSPLIIAPDPDGGKSRRLRLLPVMEDQEITGRAGGVSYWEGACDVRDEENGELVGRAYLEMTGYADNIAEKLR